MMRAAIVCLMGALFKAAATEPQKTFPWPWNKPKDTKEALADEIHVLPGWQDVLPSRMFSGLLDAGTKIDGNTTYTLHEHYFFIESEGDPEKGEQLACCDAECTQYVLTHRPPT
jgi:hypothetical protein